MYQLNQIKLWYANKNYSDCQILMKLLNFLYFGWKVKRQNQEKKVGNKEKIFLFSQLSELKINVM